MATVMPQALPITLRWPEMRDGARIATALADLSVSRMLSRVPHPYTQDDALSWIAKQADDRAGGADFAFAIDTPGADELIGVIGLHRRESPLFELGYWIAPAWWGRGVATAAGRKAIAWAQQNLHADRLIAGHFEDNPASGRVLQKLGFAYTGEREEKTCLARGNSATCLSMLWEARTEGPP